MVSIDDRKSASCDICLKCAVYKFTYLLTWAFQRTHYWTPEIHIGWDPPSWKSTWRHFFCWGWSDLDKISQTIDGAEWHVHCGDIVKIATRGRIPIWRTFGRIPWHVIPEPCITLQGAAIWWIHCHDSRATCHIAGCNNSGSHFENRFCHILFYFVFVMQFGLWRPAFVSSPIHLSFICIVQ